MAFPGQNIRKSQPQSSPLIFHDITQLFGFPRNSGTGQSFRCLVAILVSEPLLSVANASLLTPRTFPKSNAVAWLA